MRFNSLKFIAIALIAILCIITILIFGLLSYKNTKSFLVNKYDNECELVLKYTINSFNNIFDNTESIINIIEEKTINSKNDNGYNYPQIHKNLLMLEKTITKDMIAYIGMEDGSIFVAPEIQYNSPNYNHKEREWYIEAKENKNEIIWSHPYIDYRTQKIIISASKAICLPNGEILGVIGIDYDVSVISKEISKSQIGKKGYVMLLSDNSTVIANRDDYYIGRKLFTSNQNFSKAAKSKKITNFTIEGNKYDLRIERLKQGSMLLATAISKKELNKNLNDSHFYILFIGVICLVFFSVFSYYIVLRGIRPIQKLSTLMKKAESGDYRVTASINKYYEINSLANSFNSMIKSIRTRDQKLIQTNSELIVAQSKLKNQNKELQKSQKTLNESREKIKRLAYYDPLTGLSNRQNFIRKYNKLLADLKENFYGSIIYIDLDNFKKINDTRGHSIGDMVLVETAKRFEGLDIKDKLISRFGGDEFVMMIKNVVSLKELTHIIKHAINVLRQPIVIKNEVYNLTSSMGVVMFPRHGTSLEELLKKADMAMYKAKGNGKNCFEIFDLQLQLDIERKISIEKELSKALNDNEYELFYQPIFSFQENSIIGFEALLRCKSKKLKIVPIINLIKIAEETGIIVDIENWVIKTACEFIKKLNSEYNSDLRISINISVVHIMQDNFVESIIEIIDQIGVEKRYIQLEVTETVMMESLDSNICKLNKLKELGIDIHLDDFGSGYSSFNYMQSFPVNYIKIDKLFIDRIKNEKDGKIVSTIIDLAHTIGLKVIAEGVEEKEQFEILSDNRCDIAQGYYISKPVPEESIIEFMKKYI